MFFTKVLIVVMMIKIVVVVMIMVIKKMIIMIPPYKSCLCLTGIIGHITVGFQQRISIKGMLVVVVMMVVVITTTSVFEYCKIPTLDLLVTPKGSCWCR